MKANNPKILERFHKITFEPQTDDKFDEFVNFGFTEKIDFSDIKEFNKMIQFAEEYHFETNETTSIDSIKVNEAIDSTDSKSIDSINRDMYSKLKQFSPTFLRLLKRTDFEDGMTNYVSDIVENFIADNSFATYFWLNSVYSDNQKDAVVLAGLLRIIELDVRKGDEDCLLPLVKAGLADQSSMVQEAAIMVIEQWRTKNSLEALETSSFHSDLMESYANQVIEELREELNGVDA